MVIDPICCLTVDESTERRAFFNGETFYFCSEHCRKKFVSTPDADKPATTPQGTGLHTCARHPELWQQDPCACPKCRMDLEPAAMIAESNDRGKPKSSDLTARFRLAAALVSQVWCGWRTFTTEHLNRFINTPGQDMPKSRKRLRTSAQGARRGSLRTTGS